MKCRVPHESISALLDGELHGVEERRLRDHLGACATCRARFEEVRRVSRLVRASESTPRMSSSSAFVSRVVAVAESAPPRRRVGPPPSILPAFTSSPLAAAAILLLFASITAFMFLSAPAADSPTKPGETPVPSVANGDPFEVLPPDAVRSPVLARSELPPPGDLGDPLPPPPAVRPKLTGESLYLALGLRKIGDRWMSDEAYRRFREHREQEALLARGRERNAARPEYPLHPDRKPVGSEVVGAYLASLGVGDPIGAGDLTLYPLLTDGDPEGTEVFGLDEGLRKHLLSVREEQSTATIFAKNNDSARHAFVAAGEILVGGHQDRIVTRDTLIPPGWLVQLPVLCCEERRSTGVTPRFSTSPGIAPSGIRGLLLGASNQQAIWSRIREDLVEFDMKNPTRALRALYEILESDKLKRRITRLTETVRGEKVVGFIAVAKNRVLGAEIFSSPKVFRSLARRFVTSYLLESLKEEPAAAQALPAGAAGQVGALFGAVAKAARFFPGRVGNTGRESEFDGGAGELSGYAIIAPGGGNPVHVSLYAGHEAPRVNRAGGSTRTVSPGGAPPPPELPAGPNGGSTNGAERRRDDRQRRQGIPPEQRVPGTVNPPRRQPPRSTPDRPREPNDVPKVPDRSGTSDRSAGFHRR